MKDIWLAIQKVLLASLGVSFAGYMAVNFLSAFLTAILPKTVVTLLVLIAAGCVAIACLRFIYGVWAAYSAGISVDIDRDECSFPASDMENSISQILTLKPWQRRKLSATPSLR